MLLPKNLQIGLVFLLFGILLSACGPSPEELAATSAAETAEAATNTPSPTSTFPPTSTSTPTSTPRPTPIPVTKTPTPVVLYYPDSTLECEHWSIVDRTYLGDEICIYGLVYYVQPWINDWNVQFSSSAEDFKVYDVNNYYWPDIKSGDCILLKGVVRDGGKFIFLSPFVDGQATDIYRIDDDYCIK